MTLHWVRRANQSWMDFCFLPFLYNTTAIPEDCERNMFVFLVGLDCLVLVLLVAVYYWEFSGWKRGADVEVEVPLAGPINGALADAGSHVLPEQNRIQAGRASPV